MSKIDVLLVQFVHQALIRNTQILQPFIDVLKREGERIFQDIHQTTYQFDYPFDLQILCFQLLSEARSKSIPIEQILFGLRIAMQMFHERKRLEPTILPIWTGPIFTESPITLKTYDTVKSLFQTAKHEIFIVGYTFSLDDQSVRLLFNEISQASRRGCRINIIYNNNHSNLDNILNRWPPDLILPQLYYWKGSEDSNIASLHSKLIMVDQRRLLLTSANFTLHGFHQNIETGVLIENHALTTQIWEQFKALLLNDSVVKYQKR
jgi:phosphatidylserine/phosphatidylglycerophosphate/cardiolipin synthase-like enzyme